jgi:hypothetical protein
MSYLLDINKSETRENPNGRGSLLPQQMGGSMRDLDVVRMPLVKALDLGREAWECPSTGGGHRSPFMSWSWYRAWADIAAPENVAQSEVVALGNSKQDLLAICPVRLRRMRFGFGSVAALTWAGGDLGAPDHLDLPVSDNVELDALVTGLAAQPWDVMVLPDVADDAPNLRRVFAAFEARGYTLSHRALWGCPCLDLPDSWDGYLQTLSSSRRQTFRRKERKLEREHDVELVEYGPERFDEGWAHLMRLHELRWEDAGSAFTGKGPQMHRRFAQELATLGKLWLFTLNVDGEPAAAWYGFGWGRTVYFFQAGRDPEWERKSVGITLMNKMIRRAIEQGYTRFDFMRGEEGYKMKWTEHQRMCYEWVVFRPGLKGMWLRGQYRVKRLRAHLRYWREQRKRAARAGD